MNKRKRPAEKRSSDIQRLANAFHFTKQDLLLNRQGRLSESQKKRMWRRFWMALIFLIAMFVAGCIFIGFFLWGTAPDGTFPFLPSNASVGKVTDSEQLFMFAQILGIGFVVVMVIALLSTIASAMRIQQGELHTYRGIIELVEGFDENRLKLVDGGRGFDLNDAQYRLLVPLVERHQFAVYYVTTREGIVSLEPIVPSPA